MGAVGDLYAGPTIAGRTSSSTRLGLAGRICLWPWPMSGEGHAAMLMFETMFTQKLSCVVDQDKLEQGSYRRGLVEDIYK